MRNAFTLIELLVVLMLISLIISVVAPKGYKLLNSVSIKIENKEQDNKLKMKKYAAFIEEKIINIKDKNITFNKFGLKINDK